MLNWLRKGKDAFQDRELPLTEHLAELRDRLLYSAIAICICASLGFYYAREIIAFLMYPLKQAMTGLPIIPQLHFTSITEPLFQSFKIALFAGIAMAFPFWVWQLWKFVAPGLYSNERRMVTPVIMSSSLLFLIGTSFAYTIAVPMAYRFLLLYANPYQTSQQAASRAGISLEIIPQSSRSLPSSKASTPPTKHPLKTPKQSAKASRPMGFPVHLSFQRHPKHPQGWKLQVSAPLAGGKVTPQALALALIKHRQIDLQFHQGNTTHRMLLRSHWPAPKSDFLSASLTPILTLQAYLSVSSWFLLGFGLIFQTPLLILLITYAGLISATTLGQYRRHAFIAILIIAAVLTPTGDPINLMIMAIPMYILFEIGLWVSRIVEKRRKRKPDPPADPTDPNQEVA